MRESAGHWALSLLGTGRTLWWMLSPWDSTLSLAITRFIYDTRSTNWKDQQFQKLRVRNKIITIAKFTLCNQIKRDVFRPWIPRFICSLTALSWRSLTLHRRAAAASLLWGSPGISCPHSWGDSSIKKPASRLASKNDLCRTHFPAATAARYFSFLKILKGKSSYTSSHRIGEKCFSLSLIV